MNIGSIVQGHVNEMLGLNTNLAEARLKICKECPLYSTRLGGICNPRLYLNPDNGDVSTEKKDGYVKGCACRLSAKTSVVSERCVVGKW